MLTLAVSLVAGVGAVSRYLVDRAVAFRTGGAFPWGTLAVNLSGSFVLGVVTGLAAHHGLPQRPTVILSAGFAGGYTTFSTWMWESLALGEAAARWAAGRNVIGSLATGLLAAAAGLALGGV